MCLLLIADCIPAQKLLDLGEEQNRDGIGVAFRRKNKVFFKKAIEMPELIKILNKEEPPYVIHFRLASAGGAKKELCHPFPVTINAADNLALEGEANAIIAHNGHIQHWDSLARSAFINSGKTVPMGAWSDTRFLSYLTAVNGPGILRFFPSERLVYMTGHKLQVINRHLYTEYEQEGGFVLSSYDAYAREEAQRAWLEKEKVMRGFNGMPSIDGMEMDISFNEDDEEAQIEALEAYRKYKQASAIAQELDEDTLAALVAQGEESKEKELYKEALRLSQPPYQGN